MFIGLLMTLLTQERCINEIDKKYNNTHTDGEEKTLNLSDEVWRQGSEETVT